VGPRFDLAALTTSPPPPPPTTITPPPVGVAAITGPASAPPPVLPLPTPDQARATAGIGSPPNVATLSRATAAYTQTQQLTGGTTPTPIPLPPPGAPEPQSIQQQQPSALTSAPAAPTTVGTEPSQALGHSVGVVGISSLGGAAPAPSALLSFGRGTYLNILA
jgi:hypothetical protein